MKAIKIKITSFVSDDQPGFVECKLIDAWNKEHTFREKVPVVTEQSLDANTEYPKDGVIACLVSREWKDKDGRLIFTVNTVEPWDITTNEGLTDFDLTQDQLTEI
ncbi:MAG: hypothetical protein V2A54_13850 [Bacteroidota bacterium]